MLRYQCRSVPIEQLGFPTDVWMAVHGHQHDSVDSSDQWTAQGFKNYGVGLRGITAIDAEGNAEVIVS